MSGLKRYKSSDGEGFLRAFTDMWEDICVNHDVLLTMMVLPSGRKGVIILRVSAWPRVTGTDGRAHASYSCEYPTAAIASLEAWMFAALNKLDRMLLDKSLHPMGRA